MADKVLEIIKNEFHQRVIDESLARVEQCLTLLSPAEIWYKHNGNINSVGNLVLHLEGNIRQYIISGVGEKEDTRERSKEFAEGYDLDKAHLINKLSETLRAANQVVQKLDYEKLSDEVTIQGFPHTRLSAIIHVVEHLSYHVGQITYYTKYVKDVDMAYYGGLDLDV